jgi:hypothetical protein
MANDETTIALRVSLKLTKKDYDRLVEIHKDFNIMMNYIATAVLQYGLTRYEENPDAFRGWFLHKWNQE